MYFPIPDDERLFVEDTSPDRLVVTGLEVELDSDSAVSGRALIVRAGRVEITGELRLPGGRIEIFAREVIANTDARIDVSGEPGQPDYTGRTRAPVGPRPGTAGRNGKDGGDGGMAGTIRVYAEAIVGPLTLAANGGNGGKAQDGGNGAQGRTGRTFTTNDECRPPERGGPGGPAGAAGKPGRGGDAGTIEVATLRPLSDEGLTFELEAGAAGAPGVHGSPGEPGRGGNGGYVSITRSTRCSDI